LKAIQYEPGLSERHGELNRIEEAAGKHHYTEEKKCESESCFDYNRMEKETVGKGIILQPVVVMLAV
jgi:hypothetical protein